MPCLWNTFRASSAPLPCQVGHTRLGSSSTIDNKPFTPGVVSCGHGCSRSLQRYAARHHKLRLESRTCASAEKRVNWCLGLDDHPWIFTRGQCNMEWNKSARRQLSSLALFLVIRSRQTRQMSVIEWPSPVMSLLTRTVNLKHPPVAPGSLISDDACSMHLMQVVRVHMSLGALMQVRGTVQCCGYPCISSNFYFIIKSSIVPNITRHIFIFCQY